MAGSCEDVNELSDLTKGNKLNFSLQIPMKAQRRSRGIAVNFRAGQGWEVNDTARPLYFRECPRTPCTGGWLGPGPIRKVVENLASTVIRSPDRPSRLVS